MKLKDFGYPLEGIVYVDAGCGDDYEVPQEALSAHTCGSCQNFDSKEWVCKLTGEDKDPDDDFCDGIDYKEEWLDCEDGYRSPVRNEYSSDKAYEQAVKAINSINRYVREENEHEYNVRMYGKDYWRDEE